MSHAAYAKLITAAYLKSLSPQLSDFERTRDPEALHKARVFIRRIRNSLWIFRKTFPKNKQKRWNRSLAALAKELGRVRDLDVRISFFQKFAAGKKSRARGTSLKRYISTSIRERDGMLPRLDKAFRIFEHEKTIKQMKALMKEFPSRPDKNGQEELFYFSRRKILRRMVNFLKFEPYVYKPEAAAELHQMRIAAKKLRYTLESFDPFYRGQLKKFARTVAHFQDALGQVHDLDLWRVETERELRASGKKEIEKAVVYFLEICKDERDKVYNDFVGIWQDSLKKKLWIELMQKVSPTHAV